MILVGAHMSIAGGIYKAIDRGLALGCTAIQVFTKNASQWHAKPLTDKDIDLFTRKRRQSGLRIIAHNSYLINLASPKEALYRKSLDAMMVEMSRCDLLGIPYLVMHPGSHTGSGEEKGIRRIAKGIDTLYANGNSGVCLALETTSGQGTNLGYSFEQLAEIISISKNSHKLRVCYDTCHTFNAGYDITTQEAYDGTFEDFEDLIGVEKIVVIHMNDSKHPLGSGKDRHQHIGEGEIGLNAFGFIMNDKRFENVPKILETPKGEDYEFDKVNLKRLIRLVK
ncbi:deoxyribonuclease IV [bacterium]|nr:deoxyribonuclease IV [bacterium]